MIALQPYFFQATNESSLQQLSSLLANLQDSKPVRPTNLTFYIKDSTKSEGKVDTPYFLKV